jgi:hypothetical protein
MTLIAEWRKFYKFWSIQLGVIGTAITGYLIASPEAALFAWGLMPADLKEAIPPQFTPLIGVFVFVASMLARLVKQKKLHAKTDFD